LGRGASLTVDLVLSNAKAFVNKETMDCSLAINRGKIFKIGKEPSMPKADRRLDVKGLLVLPGMIDAHVHLRDEGKAYKEDFYSGTAAAAAGGITTVLDMPNNNPVTMSAETLRNRMSIAKSKILVNVGFYSEFPTNIQDIRGIVEEGAVAFKLFMTEQVGGLDIDDDNALSEAFKIAKKLGALVAVHAEDKVSLKSAEDRLKHANRNDIGAFLEAHSEDVEMKAVKRLLSIAKQSGPHIHFCHVSTGKGLKAIIEEKKTGMQVTCETTPHHLLLSSEEFKRVGTLALTMPPVREKPQINALWSGIEKGWIDTIGSDHAPHTLVEKKSEIVWNVKVGIPGLETTLPLLLTEVKRGRLSIADVVRLMSEKPAEIFKLKGRGSLIEGNNADITVVDLRSRGKIDSSKFHSKAKYSPFDGRPVEGRLVKTFVGGQLVMDEGEAVAQGGSGDIIRRE
jgi:dihydroorotase (multifunctional complex type)